MLKNHYPDLYEKLLIEPDMSNTINKIKDIVLSDETYVFDGKIVDEMDFYKIILKDELSILKEKTIHYEKEIELSNVKTKNELELKNKDIELKNMDIEILKLQIELEKLKKGIQ